ncbi:NUDIX hydrolase [Planococcus alpniumensis]|uniref:NUDIX hydrolase n=1 Tax=Planococcus alpniumensis TaxID=2708345 RepID=UPI001B8CE84D|nr:NUDIX domain-containing protein [Planococcus sp. MSAK28401]
MANRGSVVLIEEGRVALIERTRDGSVYYVFPGGDIQQHETPEAAAKREAFEELGVQVEIEGLFTKTDYEGDQYFFMAKRTGGIFGTGLGDEYTDSSRGRGTYLAVWIGLDVIDRIDVKPSEVAVKIKEAF